MRAVLVFALVVLLAAAEVNDYELLFLNFAKTHGRVYNSSAEREFRFGIFRNNMDKINSHNAQDLGWTMAMNQFGDLTAEEFKTQKTGYRPSPNRKAAGTRHVAVGLPTSVDWVSAGAVT